MSMESAVAFYERLESDTALQEKLKELNTRENIEQHVKRDLGYDFTREEMQQVVFQRHPEMSDEELEAVVGGGSGLWAFAYVGAGLLGGALAFAAVAAGAA